MNFEKPSQQETPSQIKKILEKEGEKLPLTLEEYQKFQEEQPNKFVATKENSSYSAENIIKQSKLDKEKEAEIKKEIEESFKKEDKLVKTDWTKTPDYLSVKKWEEMTPEEKEADLEFQRKHLGARSSRSFL